MRLMRGVASLTWVLGVSCVGCNSKAEEGPDGSVESGGSSGNGSGAGEDASSGGSSTGEDAGAGGSGEGGSSGTGGACGVGDEECECYPNATCNGSLTCVSDTCVASDGAGGSGSGNGGSGNGGSGNGSSGNGSSGNGGSGGTSGQQCDADHFGPDCEACACDNGGCNDGSMGSGDCDCDEGWVGAACDQRPESCKALLAAFPGSSSGRTVIDPDGAAGLLEPIDAYCDMEFSGGGWTMIMGSNALGTNSQTPGVVVPGSGTYMPTDHLLGLAATGVSSQIHIRARGAAETQSITSTASSLPMINLRALQLLNDNSGMYAASDPVVHWTGPYAADATRLWHDCGAEPFGMLAGYPSIWHSCGNGMGLHINPIRSGWNSVDNIDMEVYLR